LQIGKVGVQMQKQMRKMHGADSACHCSVGVCWMIGQEAVVVNVAGCVGSEREVVKNDGPILQTRAKQKEMGSGS